MTITGSNYAENRSGSSSPGGMAANLRFRSKGRRGCSNLETSSGFAARVTTFRRAGFCLWSRMALMMWFSGTSSQTSCPVLLERSANDVAVSSTSCAPCRCHHSKISERAKPAQTPETCPLMLAPFKTRPGLRTRFLFFKTEHIFLVCDEPWSRFSESEESRRSYAPWWLRRMSACLQIIFSKRRGFPPGGLPCVWEREVRRRRVPEPF